MKTFFSTLAFILLALTSISQERLSTADKDSITSIFMKQEAAWNAADINAFMKGYWKSDKLTFVGGSGVTYGWEATKARYFKRYPDKAAMGKLKFTILELSKIDDNSAMLIGKFYLTRAIGDLYGHYSLIWKKIGGKWVIISDHSSADTE